MKLIRSLSLILAVASAALADVEFLDPDAGATAKGGDTITVRWRDSGKEPRLSQLTKYDLYLCAGGDAADSYEELDHLITEGNFARGTSVSFRIDPEVGSDDENAYFLKMVSKGPDAEIVNYSKRFTLTQMTGTFPSNVRTGLLSVSDLNGPGFMIEEELRKRQVAAVGETTTSSETSSLAETALATGTSTSTTELAGLAETSTTSSLTDTSTSKSSTETEASTSTTSTSTLAAALPETSTSTSTSTTSTATSTSSSIDAAEFTVPYQDQLTGLTRYAPAAKHPGTTITAKSRTRQFPTSSYSVATTYLSEPTVEVTVTATATFSTSSIENTASPAPQPDSDLKRFLKRWQD